MFNAGRMRSRITILRYSTLGAGTLGTPQDKWIAELSRISAERSDVSDGEKAAAGALISVLRTRFVVRKSTHTNSVTRRDRVECEGVVFEITGIKQAERPTEWEWTCDARADA